MDNLTLIRDRFIEQITTLENLQDDIFNSIAELASPVYYNSNLPSNVFGKKNTDDDKMIIDKNDKINSGLHRRGQRVLQLKIVVDKCNNALGKFREKLETQDSLQPVHYQNMISVIQDTFNKSVDSNFNSHEFNKNYNSPASDKNFNSPGSLTSDKNSNSSNSASDTNYNMISTTTMPMILPPSISPIEDTIKRSIHMKNKIITGRLESAINIFKSITQSTRELAKNQFVLAEGVCDTQQAMIETLLRMFFRDMLGISITLKCYYDGKLGKDMIKFNKYLDHQKQLALDYQLQCHKEMNKSLRAQHILFRDMTDCLAIELDFLPLKDRNRSKRRLGELYEKNQKCIIQAELYYDVARSVVLLQPMSTIFYKEIRQWLHDYQSLLIEVLGLMLIRMRESDSIGDNVGNNVKGRRDIKDGINRDIKDGSINNRDIKDGINRDIKDGSINRDIKGNKSDFNERDIKDNKNKISTTLQKSALYNYARRLDPSRLLDLASASNCIYPTIESVNEILVGFTSFHLNSNKQNLSELKKSIEKLSAEYNELSGNNAKLKSIQQEYYNRSTNINSNPTTSTSHQIPNAAPIPDQRLNTVVIPDIRKSENKFVGDMGSAKNYVQPLVKTPPEVVKQLLKLDRESKISDARLAHLYSTLFSMDEEYTIMEQQNKKLTEIVDYLKQYSLLMREWEEKIKQEHLFVQRWNDIKKYNSRYMSMQFMEWNQFATEQVDIFHQTIGLYSTNVFYKVKELANDFMVQVIAMSSRRNGEFDNEISLINKLYNDIRNEPTTSYSLSQEQRYYSSSQDQSSRPDLYPLADEVVRVQSQFEHWTADIGYLYSVYFRSIDYRLLFCFTCLPLENMIRKIKGVRMENFVLC